MSWSFSATGTKSDVLDQLEALTPPDTDQRRTFESWKTIAIQEVQRFPEGSDNLSVSAYGHKPGDAGGTQNTTFSVTGNAPASKASESPPAA
jgi:hypothetical protein